MLCKKGLNSFQIKLIGICLMFIDHTAQFFPYLPIFFHWLGRASAPLFLFLSAEGYLKTKNKEHYLLRLILGFWFMNALSNAIIYLSDYTLEGVSNNIFGTLFLGVLYMYFIDIYNKAKQRKLFMQKLFSIFLLLAPIYLNLLLILLQKNNPLLIYKIIKLLIPLPLAVEGGVFIISLAILFYLFHENRNKQIATLFFISFIFLLQNPEKPFTENYQWMMFFSFLPILLYNNQEGKKIKLLFYIFYPLHLYLLYFLSITI